MVILFHYPVQHSDSPEEIQLQIDSIHRQSESFRFIPHLDESVAFNTVPLEETLLIADFAERRRAILSVLRTDSNRYSKIINLAIHNNDGETAHYAASSLLHQKRLMDKQLNDLEKRMNENPGDREAMITYADIITQYYAESDPDNGSLAIYIERGIEILQKLIASFDDIPVKYPSELLSLYMTTKNWAMAEQIERLLQNQYPNSETKSLALLQYYFDKNDFVNFRHEIQDARDSSLILSPQLIDNIQFWSGSIT